MELEKVLEWLKTLQDSAPWVGKILAVVVALFVGWIVAGWARRSIQKVLDGRKIDKTISRFTSNMVRYLILVGVVLGCLGVFGIETTSFAAVIGAAGLAVGLAFQGTLSNFAAGIMLLIFRPFKADDVVNAAGETGCIEQIDLFTTTMLTPDNKRIIVPNSAVFGSTITNFSAEDTCRCDVDVGCDYSADIDKTREVLEKALKSVPGRLDDDKSVVFLKGLGGSSVDWQLRIWCKKEDYWAVYQAAIRAIKIELDGAGIGIPFPQTDVHFDPQVIEALKRSA